MALNIISVSIDDVIPWIDFLGVAIYKFTIAT